MNDYEITKLTEQRFLKHTKKSTIKFVKDISNVSDYYFNHSYVVEPENKDIVVSTTIHEIEFASIINYKNIYGMQFHPEKSSNAGKTLLKNFLSL